MTRKYSNINGCYNNNMQNVRDDSRRGAVYKHYDNKVSGHNSHNAYSHNSFVSRNRNDMSQADSSDVYRQKHNSNEKFHSRRNNVMSNQNSSRYRQPNELHQGQYNQQQPNSQRNPETKAYWRKPVSENTQEKFQTVNPTPPEDIHWTQEIPIRSNEATVWKSETAEYTAQSTKSFIQDDSKFDVEAAKKYFQKKTMESIALYQQEQERKQAAGIVSEIDKVMNDLAQTRSSRPPVQSLYSLIKLAPSSSSIQPQNTTETTASPLNYTENKIPEASAVSVTNAISPVSKITEPPSQSKAWQSNFSPKGTAEFFASKTPVPGTSSFIPATYQIIAADGLYYQAAPAFIPLQTPQQRNGMTNHPQMMVLMPSRTSPTGIPLVTTQNPSVYTTEQTVPVGSSPGILLKSPTISREEEVTESVQQ